LEVEVYCVEGFCKGLQAQGGEVFDAEEEFVAFGLEGTEFVAEFLEAIVGVFVGFEGEHVDGFHCFHPFLEQADLGLEGGEVFVGLGFGGDFGDGFGKFGALDGDLDDELFDVGLALLLGEFAIYSRSTAI
jgi:hypothetical protein